MERNERGKKTSNARGCATSAQSLGKLHTRHLLENSDQKKRTLRESLDSRVPRRASRLIEDSVENSDGTFGPTLPLPLIPIPEPLGTGTPRPRPVLLLLLLLPPAHESQHARLKKAPIRVSETNTQGAETRARQSEEGDKAPLQVPQQSRVSFPFRVSTRSVGASV